MIEGTCLCGSTGWTFDGRPERATACNCTACRRYGVLWAYDYEGERIAVTGATRAYLRGDAIEFHACPTCACVMFWRAQRSHADGRVRIAVNLRMAEPDTVAEVPVERFDGLHANERLPTDGRRIADHWF